MTRRSDDRPPWKRKNPADTHTKLTPADIAEARARARAAGRTYPNLIDNMAVARRKKASAALVVDVPPTVTAAPAMVRSDSASTTRPCACREIGQRSANGEEAGRRRRTRR